MSAVNLSEIEPGIAHVELSRPERRNALSPERVDDLRAACAQIARERSVRVALLSGAGDPL